MYAYVDTSSLKQQLVARVSIGLMMQLAYISGVEIN